MPRIPAFATVTLACLLPLCAAALGLGEVQSKSFLNQPFAAEIPVVSDVAGEIAGLRVSLASADTFEQYGLQRPAFLGDLTFSVVPGPRGGVIRVTSAQPVVEPFVTLLLDVRWAQGRLLREYTVLLDPPAFTGGVVRQPVETPKAAAPTTAPIVRAAREAEPEAPATAPSIAGGDGGTHTVVRNETLWGIADRYRADASTDINQLMLAFYRANPNAFAGNINRLRAGAVLRIPEGEEIGTLGRQEARTEVRRQYQEWRESSAQAPPARLELVPPPETAKAPVGAAAAGTGDQAQLSKLQSDLEEARRLLAVRDAELKALQDRMALLEQAREAEVEVPPAPAPPEVAPVAEEPAAVVPLPEAQPPATAEKPAPPVEQPAPARAAEQEEGGGILRTIGSLFTSIWLWVVAAVVLITALLISRRRSAAEEALPWRPRMPGGADEGLAPHRGGDDDMIVIEEPSRASATGGFERRATPRGAEELPLERTISAEGPVNLDQADPLAEADFHMAYGLYDQAADLLTAAIAREPTRRDLQLKLLDVYFVWENREGFLKEARALRDRIGNQTDPDWKRVVFMGKQLCPTEAMFAGATVPGADEMDLAFSGGTVDLPIGGGGGLDLDLSDDQGADFDSSASTKVARPSWTSAQTQEIPTIEAPGVDSSSTMETPTLESPELSPTTEQPTIETPMGDSTLETPTVETWSPELGTTTRLQTPGRTDDRTEQTEEIDLEELGLDLTGLDEAARDMTTGMQELLPGDGQGSDKDLDLDLSGGDAAVDHDDATSQLEKSPTLSHLTRAIGKGESAAGADSDGSDDTVEQPVATDSDSSRITRSLSATSDELETLNIDLDLGGSEPSDLTATGLRAIRPRGPDDATMTEVGTKLDLARAYLDMGDPDGARSILNEVLEEGDPAQRQEARQLLDGLDG